MRLHANPQLLAFGHASTSPDSLTHSETSRFPVETLKKSLSIEAVDSLVLCGRNDRNLLSIERDCGISLVARGDRILLDGPPDSIRQAEGLLSHVIETIQKHPDLGEEDVRAMIEQGQQSSGAPADDDIIIKTYRNSVQARTPGQSAYLRAIERHDIVFSIGPAGTGKTYLAVAAAVAALRQQQVSRIVLARPAVEAGESLGYLPGALEDKVDPYLRPLYDALQDLLEPERLVRFQTMKVVEVVPLAFMRGRTLNDSFIILDEAQNTTPTQMKMFLTRLGAHSKAVVTGDITQVDLPPDQPSGLIEVRSVLSEIEGLAFCHLTERDVVRNSLVQRIIKAYDSHENGLGKDASRASAETSHREFSSR